MRKIKVEAEDKYGRWTVLERDPHPDRYRYWKCRCQCGVVKTLHISNLRRKDREPRCRECYYRDNIGKNNYTWKGSGEVPRRYWNTLVTSAEKIGRKVEITIEDISNLFEKQLGRCAISGVQLYFGGAKNGKYTPGTASLDRIDSSIHYTIDNIQWVHKTVNSMKTDLPENVFLEWCKTITCFQQSLER